MSIVISKRSKGLRTGRGRCSSYFRKGEAKTNSIGSSEIIDNKTTLRISSRHTEGIKSTNMDAVLVQIC